MIKLYSNIHLFNDNQLYTFSYDLDIAKKELKFEVKKSDICLTNHNFKEMSSIFDSFKSFVNQKAYMRSEFCGYEIVIEVNYQYPKTYIYNLHKKNKEIDLQNFDYIKNITVYDLTCLDDIEGY